MKPSAASLRDRLRAQLADLKMPGALEALDDDPAPARRRARSPRRPRSKPCSGAQITLRNHRRLVAAMRSSRLPAREDARRFRFQLSARR